MSPAQDPTARPIVFTGSASSGKVMIIRIADVLGFEFGWALAWFHRQASDKYATSVCEPSAGGLASE